MHPLRIIPFGSNSFSSMTISRRSLAVGCLPGPTFPLAEARSAAAPLQRPGPLLLATGQSLVPRRLFIETGDVGRESRDWGAAAVSNLIIGRQ